MAFSEEDRIVTQYLRQNQNYRGKRFLRELCDIGRKLGGLDYLLRKIDKTDSRMHRAGSCRPRTTRTDETIEQVQDLVLSQEGRPHTHLSQREIMLSIISKLKVYHILLKCKNHCINYCNSSRGSLFPIHSVNKI